jgi:hypothetical protein
VGQEHHRSRRPVGVGDGVGERPALGGQAGVVLALLASVIPTPLGAAAIGPVAALRATPVGDDLDPFDAGELFGEAREQPGGVARDHQQDVSHGSSARSTARSIYEAVPAGTGAARYIKRPPLIDSSAPVM